MADDDWEPINPSADADWEPIKPAERGVLERAGSAASEAFTAGKEALRPLDVPPETKEDLKAYQGPSGAWRSFKETGAALAAPLTMAGAALAPVESLAASGLGWMQRGLEGLIAKGAGEVSPEAQKRLEANIPTSEEAYETARPYASAALGAIRAPAPGTPPPMPPAPRRGPLGVTLSEGQETGALPAIRREQAGRRAQAGDPAYEHTVAFDAQQEAQIEAAKAKLAADLDQVGGQAIVTTSQQAGELVSSGVTSARDIAKAQLNRAYEEARALPGQIHIGAFESMPQQIKGDLTLAEPPVIIDRGATPAAANMMDYLDSQVGKFRIQNMADPFGAPSPENIVGVDLNGVDRWRRNLSLKRGMAKSDEDRRAAGSVLDAFDNRVDAAVNSGLFTGDPDAINAWNAARRANFDYRSTFTQRTKDPVGRVVEQILGKGLKDPATPNDVMNFITGASGLPPNTTNVSVAKRLKDILGVDSPEWVATKQGVFRKLVERPEDVKNYGAGVIANRLGEFLNGKGRAFANVVYAPQEQQMLRSYLDLMRKVEIPQAGVQWSNNATPIAQATYRIIRWLGTGLGFALGYGLGGGSVTAEALGAGAGFAAAEATEQFQRFAHARQLAKQMPLITTQIKQWQRAVAAAQGQPALGRPALAVASRDLAQRLVELFTPQQRPLSQAQDEKKQPIRAGYKRGGSAVAELRPPNIVNEDVDPRIDEKSAYLGEGAPPEQQMSDTEIRQFHTAIGTESKKAKYARGGSVPKGRVSIKFDVRSGAVASKNHPGLVYIDRHIPKRYWPFLVEHELAEQRAMASGHSYEEAHTKFATPAEKAAVQRAGLDWAKYTHQLDGYLATIEHEKHKNPPPDPHVPIESVIGHHGKDVKNGGKHEQKYSRGGSVFRIVEERELATTKDEHDARTIAQRLAG